MDTMEKLFGVKDAQTGRIRRTGHWVPRVTGGPYWAYRPSDAPDESVFATDSLCGEALGQALDLTLVSPRPCSLTTGTAIISTGSGNPGLVHRKVGQGHAFLLGFCLQDTYFKTWQDENTQARSQLRGLLHALTQMADVRSHVHSSNPDLEASIRTSAKEGFLFVINHESEEPNTSVTLADLEFETAGIVDLADGRPVPFTRESGTVRLSVSAPLGETRLLHLLPK
jgi:hypothetical protein